MFVKEPIERFDFSTSQPSHTSPSPKISPHSLSHTKLLQMQRSRGNLAVERLLTALASHSSARQVSEPGDRAEIEANATRPAGQIPAIQTRSDSPALVSPLRLEGFQESGQEIPASLRKPIEQHVGADLREVRVHTGPEADALARALGARAFTAGGEIFFRKGEYTPYSAAGQTLLAHEAVHTLQQQGVGAVPPQELPQIQRQNWGDSLNNPDNLKIAVSLEQLFDLYATNSEYYAIGPLVLRDQPTYTKSWVRGSGEQAVRTEITSRMVGLNEGNRIQLMNYIDNSMHPKDFDSARKLWLRDQVGAGLPLTYDQRIELRRLVGDRMNDAYTDYSSAAQANAAAIKAAIASEAALLSLFIDVFMGLAAPGLSKEIAGLVKNIPENAANAAFRTVLTKLDEKNIGLALAAATKVGKESIKMNAASLFGETDVDLFIRGLKNSFRQGTDAVNQDLPNRTDTELGVLAITFDPSVSNEQTYIPIIKDIVNRFRGQVQPIGPVENRNVTDPIDRTVTTQNEVVWVQHGSEMVLTLVQLQQDSLHSGMRLFFGSFIDRDLKDVAIARARLTQPRGIQIVPDGMIINFPSRISEKAARP